MNAREEIMARLPQGGPARLPEPWPARNLDGALWSLFWDRLEELGGSRTDWESLAAIPGRRWSVDPGICVPERAGPFLATGPWDADLGLTRVLLAVAETGSLVVTGGRRLGSLAPPVHIGVVREADIVATLEDAIRLCPGSSTVFVTGPSRTADIEGVLVRGVHGPREVQVLVTD